jgi:dephospho-CoA kinase
MIVGLTGGIGSGKTTVARLLETMGCVLYNSDDRAKELYFDAAVKADVIALLGAQAYSENGALNKAHISEKVFSDKALLQQLNGIIHPAVKKDFEVFAERFPKQIVIKESAILFETGIYKDLEATILVTAPLHEKIERVMARNHVTSEEVEKRMQAQWTDEQKIPLADYVIGNADNQALIPQALEILTKLREHAQA